MKNRPGDDVGTPGSAAPVQHAADVPVLRLAAGLLVAGVVLSLLAGLLHPDSAPANDHAAAFADYARSDIWIGVHLGQFAGMALLIAGLLAMVVALNVRDGAMGWVARFGAVFVVAALALYAALQAVDGVALKHAVDAWASAAAGPEKAIRFAAAEDIRWLEWGLRSYQSVLLGVGLVLFGIVIAATDRVSRLIGYLMGLSGLAYLLQSWVVGTQGFSAANNLPTLAGIVLVPVWSVWLLVSGWRGQRGQRGKSGQLAVGMPGPMSGPRLPHPPDDDGKEA
jgi:hypothetical protein